MTDPKPPEERDAQQRGKAVVRAVVHVLVLAGGLALYILLGLVLWWALNRYIDPQNSSQRGDVLQALALLMAGVAAAVGIYFTWRGQGITREGQQISRENIEVTRESAEEQVRLTQEGQSTERFTRALDQLGATDESGMKRLEIRLGAIYELGQVSVVSQVLREPILQVLAAYVRENAPLSPQVDDARGSEEEPSERLPFFRPSSDIEAILDVLSRTQARVPKEYRTRLDLHEADLQGAFLQGANLSEANLREASLRGANLQVANLQGAFLQGAWLREANLQATNLQRADLQYAGLQGAFLQGAFLQEASLQKANLQEANLEASNLLGASLEAADLRYANLQRANDITKDQIESTIGSSETKLPEGLNHPELWSKSPEEQEDILLERIDEEQRNILLGRLSSAEESDSGK